MAGSGARGMVGVAFGLAPGAGYDACATSSCTATAAPAAGDARVRRDARRARRLDARALRWGIVTNKALRLAEPIADGLGLRPRAAVLVGGDSTPTPSRTRNRCSRRRAAWACRRALRLRGRRPCATCAPAAPPAC
jgi:hypothetical protein